MDRSATAIWEGDLKSGHGSITSPSGALRETPYSFATRFEDKPGTNPEELIAAAHAACFSMALSGELKKTGIDAGRIETKATVKLERRDEKWTVTRSHLQVTARAPNLSRDTLEQAAGAAKTGCPISRLLVAEITMEASIAG